MRFNHYYVNQTARRQYAITSKGISIYKAPGTDKRYFSSGRSLLANKKVSINPTLNLGGNQLVWGIQEGSEGPELFISTISSALQSQVIRQPFWPKSIHPVDFDFNMIVGAGQHDGIHFQGNGFNASDLQSGDEVAILNNWSIPGAMVTTTDGKKCVWRFSDYYDDAKAYLDIYLIIVSPVVPVIDLSTITIYLVSERGDLSPEVSSRIQNVPEEMTFPGTQADLLFPNTEPLSSSDLLSAINSAVDEAVTSDVVSKVLTDNTFQDGVSQQVNEEVEPILDKAIDKKIEELNVLLEQRFISV